MADNLRIQEDMDEIHSHDENYEFSVTSLHDITGNNKTQEMKPTAGDEKRPGSFIKRFVRFFFRSSITSYCLRIILLSLFLVAFGGLGFNYFPNSRFGPIPVPPTAIFLGCYFFGFAIILLLLHSFVVFCHSRRLFYKWSFIHYLSELEKYIAAMIITSGLVAALSFKQVQVFADTWIFLNSETRQLTVKIELGKLLTVALLAIKRHFMTGLAISFNYSNYKDRIQESLFADHFLSLLYKARHTYKFRQKWRTHGGNTTNDLSTRPKPSITPPPLTTASLQSTTARSAMDIFSASPSNLSSPPLVSPPPPPSQAAPGSNPEANPKSPVSIPMQSVADHLTESDKKVQFSEFFRLANKTMARFSSTADYRSEIQAEAVTMSKKLFKYLRNSNRRDYLLGQDLLPYIEDEAEFIKAVSMLKRYSESSYQGANLKYDQAVSFAFGLPELARAIDGILTEIYVTAKSLQTIETALDKVDMFFTLLVGLVMVIIVSILVGDAVKLLLALSTMFSGAAFAFGTSARNMFESMVFLLVIHPFDVGDRIFAPLGTTTSSMATTVASMSGVDSLDNLIVSEMHLLSTVFERWDGVKLYVPNYVLSSKPIFNIRRSGALFEIQRIHIDFSTPMSKIEELRRRLESFTKREQCDFTDATRILIDSVENCNRINLNVYFQHMTNWQDLETQLARRSKMLTFLKETIDALEISYLPPIQRIAIVPYNDNEQGTKLDLLTGAEVKKLMEISRNRQLPI